VATTLLQTFSHKKLCSRLFSTEVEFYWQKQHNRVLCHPLGDLGVTYTFYPWIVGKRVVDFLLVLIELFRQFSRLRRYERILVEIVVFERGWVYYANFRGRGLPPTTFGVRKLKSLGYHATLFA